MNPRLPTVLPSKSAVATRAAELITEAVFATLQTKPTCHLALAGGTSWNAAYQLLGNSPYGDNFPFEQVEIWFGDERWVPQNHPNSNFLAARTAFGDHWCRFKAVHPMVDAPLDAHTPEEAARLIGQQMPERFNLLLLGMGEDGHVASLFPNSRAFSSNKDSAPTMAVIGPKPPPQRITITPGVITNADQLLIVVTGAAKSNALADVWHLPTDPPRRPAQLALEHGTWLTDQAAASHLKH